MTPASAFEAHALAVGRPTTSARHVPASPPPPPSTRGESALASEAEPPLVFDPPHARATVTRPRGRAASSERTRRLYPAASGAVLVVPLHPERAPTSLVAALRDEVEIVVGGVHHVDAT